MPQNSARHPQLAVDGGMAVRSTPFAPWPYFDDEQIAAASRVLSSGRVNYWTGQQCRLFEEEFAKFVGSRHAIATANGTLALELALQALGIGPGDDVIVPARTFIASASCVVMRGARPVIADVDPESQNLTADTIRAALTSKTKAVIAVHLAGWPCDMTPIMELAKDHNLKVIEDCAQAHGASYCDQPVGAIGDVAAFSFCQDKIMTTGGEGGMLTTNNRSLYEKAWSFKDHGKDWAAVHDSQQTTVFRWVHESFGTNFRMTEMQAAIGRVALRNLPQWLTKRRMLAAVLNRELSRFPSVRVVRPHPTIGHSYYKHYAFLRLEELLPDWTRDRVVRALQAEGIPCGSGICPEIYMEGAFANGGLQPSHRLPTARQIGESSLMFPVHPTLTDRDMRDIGAAMQKVLAVATNSATAHLLATA